MSILMITHPKGRPHLTNNMEVATMFQVDEELRHSERHLVATWKELQTKICESPIRQILVADFGGSTLIRWKREFFELPDGTEFSFWPHQYSMLTAIMEECIQNARFKGYGILETQMFPIILSLQDLEIVFQYLLDHGERLILQEAQMLEEFSSGYQNVLSRTGKMLHVNTDPPDLPGLRVMGPAPSEVQ